MAVAAAVAALLASALLAAAPAGTSSRHQVLAQDFDDPVLNGLEGAAAARAERIVVTGTRSRRTDPPNDQGNGDPAADTLFSELFELKEVPDYLLMDGGLFGCDMAACTQDGMAAGTFDNGGWLVIIHLAGPISTLPTGSRGEWGVLWALDRYPTTAVAPGNVVGGYSHLNIVRMEGDMRMPFEYGVGTGSFEQYKTRSRFIIIDGEYVAGLTPNGTDLQTRPLAYTTYTFTSDGTQAGTGRDVIGSIGDAPVAIGEPAQLTFEDAAAPAPTPTPTPTPTPPPAATPTPPSTPPPGTAPTAGAAGIDPILLVILVLGAILILLGWWLLRGRGRRSEPPKPVDPGPTRPARPGPPAAPPPGPGAGDVGPPTGPGGPVVGDPGKPLPPIPPPPPPPPRNCVEGDEEWRNDKPPTSFLIAPADARVRLTTDPTTPELEAWMAQYGFPHGATAAGFGAVDDAALDALLAGLPAGPATYHWVFEFQLDEYRLECQRKWRCEADVWIPTDETRLLEAGPTPYAGRFAVDGPARTRDDVRTEWLKVRAAMVGASAAEAAMDAYRKAC